MFGQLHYPGNVTAAAKPGSILGYQDPTKVIWEVLDSEFDIETNRTTVNLQPAGRDALVAAGLMS